MKKEEEEDAFSLTMTKKGNNKSFPLFFISRFHREEERKTLGNPPHHFSLAPWGLIVLLLLSGDGNKKRKIFYRVEI